jgi:anti-sigma factor RsiW
MAAAAVFVFAIGLSSGWMLRGTGTPILAPDERLIAAAVDAHQLFSVQKRHPVEVVATERAHLTSWLSNTLDRRLVMPDLSPSGLTLVGGRLLPSGASAAAQVMYETADGDRVTLYITPRAPGDPGTTRFEKIGTLGALYWATAAITCTIVGDLPRADMEAVAHHVFADLSVGDENYRPG